MIGVDTNVVTLLDNSPGKPRLSKNLKCETFRFPLFQEIPVALISSQKTKNAPLLRLGTKFWAVFADVFKHSKSFQVWMLVLGIFVVWRILTPDSSGFLFEPIQNFQKSLVPQSQTNSFSLPNFSTKSNQSSSTRSFIFETSAVFQFWAKTQKLSRVFAEKALSSKFRPCPARLNVNWFDNVQGSNQPFFSQIWNTTWTFQDTEDPHMPTHFAQQPNSFRRSAAPNMTITNTA